MFQTFNFLVWGEETVVFVSYVIILDWTTNMYKSLKIKMRK